MRRSHLRHQGWLLVGFIVLVGAVFVALATLSLLLAEQRRTISHIENHTEAIYLAQAGVMQALYNYRRGAYVRLATVNTVDAGPLPGQADDDVFILGHETLPSPQADFFLLNWKGTPSVFPQNNYCPSSGPGAVPRDLISGWSVRNVLQSGAPAQMSLVMTALRVTWSAPAAGEAVIRIDFNGTGSDWTGPGCGAGCTAVSCAGIPNDTTIDLTGIPAGNRTIGPQGRWATNRIWFRTTNMDTKAWIEVLVTLSDGSTRWTRYEPTVVNRTADFTLRSRGEVRKGTFPFSVWRRLQAEYRICHAEAVNTNCDAAAEELSQRTGAVRSYQELTPISP